MPHVLEQHNNRILAWDIPKGCNAAKYEVHLDYRRKSGRSVLATYTVDSASHAVAIAPSKAQQQENDAELLKGLTTFNLTTSTKNQQAKDNVELPFLESQKYGDGGVQGGAIVYQYEKDDDYDEEDPYEDPF
ncbi:Elongator complex protein 5 [Yarrowia sp. C11]|nr:Elongator complex protein 5 [Yarrowia sp. C11]